jgi:hypothetical protein
MDKHLRRRSSERRRLAGRINVRARTLSLTAIMLSALWILGWCVWALLGRL